MAQSVTLKSVHSIRPVWSDTDDALNPVTGSPTIDAGVTFTYDATAAGATQGKRLYCNTLTFSGTTPQTLDLDSITDQVLGAGSAFAKVKFIYIENTDDTTVLTVSGDWFTSVFPSCTGLALQPGMSIQLCRPDATGMAVTATTADELTMTPTDGGTASVIIYGA